MLEHNVLGDRLILLAVQEADQVAEEVVPLELLTDDQLALIHLAFEELAAERDELDITGGRRDQPENLRRFHHLEQIAELELQIARDLVTVVAAAAIFQRFEQAEDPSDLAI